MIRLLRFNDGGDLELDDFNEDTSSCPPYAILSHTWENDQEVTYQEVLTGTGKLKAGWNKICAFMGKAAEMGLHYGWIYTCCIDKSSSAELSEAINSMFRWYWKASVCLIHLADVREPSPRIELWKDIVTSRWFKRGWTLQELVASERRYFFARNWSIIEFPDYMGANTNEAISSTARIPSIVLEQRTELYRCSIAERMSWAAQRETTRPEDLAYSLMGLFSINMPILYGEGLPKAFRRLQDEIMKTSSDQSLFAWSIRDISGMSTGLLAQKPQDFRRCTGIRSINRGELSPFFMTNIGLSIRLQVFQHPADTVHPPTIYAALQCSGKDDYGGGVVLLELEHIPGATCVVNGKPCNAFRRIPPRAPWKGRRAPNGWWIHPYSVLDNTPWEDVLILEDEHFGLFSNAPGSSQGTPSPTTELYKSDLLEWE
jgi:hypothetical protein